MLGSGARIISYFGNYASAVKVKDKLKTNYDLDVVDLIKSNEYLIPETSIFINSISGTRTIVNSPKQDQTISFMLNKGVEFIAITNNKKDISVYEAGNSKIITVAPVNDTSGAGDVLHGAFCYCLTEGCNKHEALCKAAKISSGSYCYFSTHTWKEYE